MDSEILCVIIDFHYYFCIEFIFCLSYNKNKFQCVFIGIIYIIIIYHTLHLAILYI